MNQGKVLLSTPPARNDPVSAAIESKEHFLQQPLQDPLQKFSSLSVTPPFVLKLCSMLATEEFSHLVAWGEQNDTVLVRDLARFSSEVLPKYFKHRNFTSFLRQLNMYGFYTLKQGENWREFKNELFRKNGTHDYDKIKRKTAQGSSKDTQATKSSKGRQSIGFSSSFHDVKESRKRKKDVFKGKNQKSLSSKVIEQQKDLIKQLLRRCEANEERIEKLEEKMETMERCLLQIRREGTNSSAAPTAASSLTSRANNEANSKSKSPLLKAEEAETTIEFGPDFYSSFQSATADAHQAHQPFEARQRTLSDTFVSVGGASNPHAYAHYQNHPHHSSFGQNYDFRPHGEDMQEEIAPIRSGSYRKSSFDEMSLSMFSHSRQSLFFSDVKQERPKKKVDPEKVKRKKKAIRLDN